MSNKPSRKINRRDLLKLMSAGAGGIAASAFLPARWTKPVINAGVSPVHAQASIPTGTIKGITYVAVRPQRPTSSQNGSQWQPAFGNVVSVDGSPALTSTTGEDGSYTITGVPAGSQTISVVPAQPTYTAYDPASAVNVPVTVTANTDSIQDFYFWDDAGIFG